MEPKEITVEELIDKERFENKLIHISNQDRSEDELIGILELVENLEDEIVDKVTLKIKNDPSLQSTQEVLKENEYLRTIRKLD